MVWQPYYCNNTQIYSRITCQAVHNNKIDEKNLPFVIRGHITEPMSDKGIINYDVLGMYLSCISDTFDNQTLSNIVTTNNTAHSVFMLSHTK